jgi:triosephosphate isomerase
MTATERRPLVSANWKMNLSHLDAIPVVQHLAMRLYGLQRAGVDVSIHPSFTALRSVQTLIATEGLSIFLGAQNVHWEARGAYTGEISALMLAKLNVSYVIVGHSERRRYFGETDDMVNRKVIAVTQAGMTPIMCVGDTLAERESGVTKETVVSQMRKGLVGLDPDVVATLVVAYEPIWAIGTGRAATPNDAQEVAAVLRRTVASDFGTDAAARVRIQYGGSVQPANVTDFLTEPDIDGTLVGGASLDPDEMAQIIRLAVIHKSSRSHRVFSPDLCDPTATHSGVYSIR